MRAETAREQAIAVGHLNGRIRGATYHVDAAGEAVAPVLNVICGMPHDRRLAGGARGCVDAGNVFLRNCEQAERVGVAHILLDDKRELREILEAGQVVGRDTRLGEGLLIEIDVVIRVTNRLLHSLELQLAQLLARHGLDFFLEIHLKSFLVLPGACAPLPTSPSYWMQNLTR